jgi:hypothetical protein
MREEGWGNGQGVIISNTYSTKHVFIRKGMTTSTYHSNGRYLFSYSRGGKCMTEVALLSIANGRLG